MVIKTNIANRFLQNEIVLPPCFLHSDASNGFASTTKAPILSRLVRAHTYIKNNWCEFWYPNLFKLLRVSTLSNPNIGSRNIYSIIAKLCQMAFATSMCTSIYSSTHIGVSMVAYVVCHGGVYIHVEHVFEFQPTMIKSTFAQ